MQTNTEDLSGGATIITLTLDPTAWVASNYLVVRRNANLALHTRRVQMTDQEECLSQLSMAERIREIALLNKQLKIGGRLDRS